MYPKEETTVDRDAKAAAEAATAGKEGATELRQTWRYIFRVSAVTVSLAAIMYAVATSTDSTSRAVKTALVTCPKLSVKAAVCKFEGNESPCITTEPRTPATFRVCRDSAVPLKKEDCTEGGARGFRYVRPGASEGPTTVTYQAKSSCQP